MSDTASALWWAAATSASFSIALGFLARRQHEVNPTPGEIFPQTVERGPLPALVLTRSGYAPSLSVFGLVAAGASLALHAPLVPMAAIVVLQLLSQSAAHALKKIFRRSRPLHWQYRREPGFSYPSGHATTAVVFYGGLLLLVVSSTPSKPLRALAVAVFVPWILGICWSRLALRAHHPSDVLGGALLGAAFLCAGLALFARLPQAAVLLGALAAP